MNKEKYCPAKVEVHYFETSDIVTSSVTDGNGFDGESDEFW